MLAWVACEVQSREVCVTWQVLALCDVVKCQRGTSVAICQRGVCVYSFSFLPSLFPSFLPLLSNPLHQVTASTSHTHTVSSSPFVLETTTCACVPVCATIPQFYRLLGLDCAAIASIVSSVSTNV